MRSRPDRDRRATTVSDRLRSGIVGAGFIGEVHARAVHAAGGIVTAVIDGTWEGTADAAVRLQAVRPAESIEELVTADDVDVVHVCTPNNLHPRVVLLALEAGKHVICEKPLATDAVATRQLLDAAERAGVVAGVPFVYRFYPTVRDARERVSAGETGPVRLLHGSYLQDWLAHASETNWRVDPIVGGESRAFADIGVHWCDLVEFVTGQRIVALSARLLTMHAQRNASTGIEPVGTEDAAVLLFETDGAAVGSLVVSQVSHGRKNRLWFSLDGTRASLSFDQELPDTLWIGRSAMNATVFRGSSGTTSAGHRYDMLPPGHPQGYQDCFNAFVSDVYAAIAGAVPDGLPTFADGHRAAVLTAAVLDSARRGAWTEVA